MAENQELSTHPVTAKAKRATTQENCFFAANAANRLPLWHKILTRQSQNQTQDTNNNANEKRLGCGPNFELKMARVDSKTAICGPGTTKTTKLRRIPEAIWQRPLEKSFNENK